MKFGILFSGQGSQKSGMGYDLYRKYPRIEEFYDALSLKDDIKQISFFGEEDLLRQTVYTQPVMVAFQLAILKELETLDLPICFTAGVSLGEFSALVAAHMIGERDCLSLIEKRARLMSEACHSTPSALIAVLGRTYEEVEGLQKRLADRQINFEIANYNSPTEVVIGCAESEEKKLMVHLEEEKILHKKLRVEGAFHTSFMTPASRAFESELKKVKFSKPSMDIGSNYTGALYDGEDPAYLLARQMNHTTYFKKILELMEKKQIDHVIEVGFNHTIKKMIKRTCPSMKVLAVNDVKSMEKIKELYAEASI